LAKRRSKPNSLGLVGVELKSIGTHPLAHVTYAVRDTALELATATRPTEAVYLRIVCIEVRDQTVCTNQSKQICRVQ
jgi:hypothetical protein